jgi:hypothetical protein
MIKIKTHGTKNKVCKPQGCAMYLTLKINKNICRITFLIGLASFQIQIMSQFEIIHTVIVRDHL